MTAKDLRFSVLLTIILLLSLSVFAQAEADSIRVKALIDSAINAKSPQARMVLASRAFQVALNTQSKKLIADATHAVAAAHFRLNNYDAAIDSLQKSLVMYNLLSDSAGIAKTYYTLGTCFIRKSDYVNAINFTEKVINFASASNDSTLLANSFNTMGYIYYLVESYQLSIDFFEKALKLYQNKGSIKNQVRVLGNIGLSYVKIAEYEKAREVLFGTLRNFEKNIDTLLLASLFDNVGTFYEALGKVDSALYYHNRSLVLSKKVNSIRGIALSYTALGRCYMLKKQWIDAKKCLITAYELAKKNDEKDLVAQIDRHLAKCYESLGENKKSIDHLNAYFEYNDKTFTRHLTSQIAQLHSLLILEKKERENELLQTELNLKKLNEQKDKLIINLYTIFSLILILSLGVAIYFAVQLRYRKKQLEHLNYQLSQFNQQLDSQVRHRTRELNDAFDKILELERIKSAFLANISHEIRTPLNGILGLSYYLALPECTVQERKDLGEQVKKLGDRLLGIVDDILELSKIETNQVNLLLTEFNLNAMLHEIEQIFANDDRFSEKKLFFRIVKKDVNEQPIIVSDYNRLKSIVIHLLENAFKFTHEGGIEIGYSIRQNSLLSIYVKDTGVGIPYEIQNKVFERFYKHRQEDSDIFYDGVGIGLTIAMGYALALGGSIKVKSIPGKGSTFTLTLPVTLQQNGNIQKTTYDFNGKRILVVEDDLISYQYLHALLSKTGATVIHVKNAEDAIEVATIDPNINLILLDLQLPFKSGIEAAAEIRKINTHTPIIAQTASDNFENIQACKKVGCNAFLTKPIDPDELLSLVRQMLNP